MIKKNFYLLTFIVFAILPGLGKAQVISTVAGTFNGDGYSARSIGLNPVGAVTDSLGNMYIAVPDRHVVMKLSVAGVFSTVAGTGVYGFKGDNGPAIAAQLRSPWKVAVDKAGNVFIADNLDNRIRKVTPAGIITTVAGNGGAGFSGDGGQAIYARMQGPADLAIDGSGNLFVADYVNRRVRKIAPNGIISTVAGSGVSGRGGDGGSAKLAQLGFVTGISVNSRGELFIADNTNSTVRKMDVNGIISTVAGSGVKGFSGDGGDANLAAFNAINGVAADKLGNIYIADAYNNRVRKINASGVVTTVAGTGGGSFSGDNGAATAAQMYRPSAIAIDKSGNLLISGNFRVRKVTISTGIITTMAGNGTGGYCGDNGPVTKAQMYHPVAVAVDKAGNMFFVDRENHRVRKVSTTGVITTVAGRGTPGFSGDGGLASSALLNLPTSVAVDRSGNVFIADYTNNRIRKVNTSGIISTIAGVSGSGGFNGDGTASIAKLWGPDGVTTDAAGNVFFADQYNNRIRKITPGGIISTVAGSGVKGFAGDNGPATQAALYWPNNVKVDNAGNIFIVDRRNNRVRKVSGGIIKTVAGNGGQTAGGDGGSATLAAVDASAVAIDSSGNIFIADTQNERIRRVNTRGIISTLVSKVRTPTGLSTDAAGNVFTCEYDNHRIQEVSLAGVILSRSSDAQAISALPVPAVKFTIYPNPVQSTLYIQTPEAGALKYVELLDVAGKVLLAQKPGTAQSFVTLQLNRLASGTYFVRTTGIDNTVTVKEIVKD